MENYITKFDLFKKLREKIKGINEGLNFLDQMNFSKIKKSNIVECFDYNSLSLQNYDYNDLNYKFQELYLSEEIYRKIMIYNKLYNIMRYVYDELYLEYNYPYKYDIIDSHMVIHSFFKCLRKSSKKNSLDFFVPFILVKFNIQFFHDDITPEMFCDFIIKFLFRLQDHNILDYDSKTQIIKFKESFEYDLMQLVFCSFDLMILGDKNSFDSISPDSILNEHEIHKLIADYSRLDFGSKFYLDDVLKCYVIASITPKITFDPIMNNLLFDKLKV